MKLKFGMKKILWMKMMENVSTSGIWHESILSFIKLLTIPLDNAINALIINRWKSVLLTAWEIKSILCNRVTLHPVTWMLEEKNLKKQ